MMKHMKMIVGAIVLIVAMAGGYHLYQRHQAALSKDDVRIQSGGCGSCGKHLMKTGVGCVPC